MQQNLFNEKIKSVNKLIDSIIENQNRTKEQIKILQHLEQAHAHYIKAWKDHDNYQRKNK